MRFLLNIGLVLIVFCSSGADHKQHKRSKPPKEWDKLTKSFFSENAFSFLDGQKRPDFNEIKSGTSPLVSDNKEPQNKKETIDENIEESKDDFDMSDMMSKLESCEDSLRDSLQTEGIFQTSTKQIDTYSDIIIMLGRTLANSNPEYDDPDSFLKYAQNMKDNAQALKVFAKQKKYKEAYEHFKKIQKNCNDCHTQYRL